MFLTNHHQPAFILASGSPRRREFITALGIVFEIVKPDVDESLIPGEPPLAYVQRLSRVKAETVAAALPAQTTILAADTIVILAADTIGIDEQGEILGKPADADEAEHMLRRLRGREHLVCTAFTVMRTAHDTPRRISGMVRTRVRLREYTDAEIAAYIASGDPFDKAGSYAIQNTAFHPVAALSGCSTNVVGLPVCAVRRALVALDWPGITAAPEGCDCPPYPGYA